MSTVVNSGDWKGLTSGVPGLGASVPVPVPRAKAEADEHDAYWSGNVKAAASGAGKSAPSKLFGLRSLRQRKNKKKSASSSSSSTASKTDSASLKSSESSAELAANHEWSAHSLQSLSHLKKLDLPRVGLSDAGGFVNGRSSGASESADSSASHSRHSSKKRSLSRSLAVAKAESASSNTGAVPRIKRPLVHHTSSVPQFYYHRHSHNHHHHLNSPSRKQISSPQLTVVSAEVHWSSSSSNNPEARKTSLHQPAAAAAPVKRTTSRRQSCHWDRLMQEHQQQQQQGYSSEHDTATVEAAGGGTRHRGASSFGNRKSYFDQRFPHLAAILQQPTTASAECDKQQTMGPSSMPVRFDLPTQRPPLPTPPSRTARKKRFQPESASSSETSTSSEGEEQEKEEKQRGSKSKSHYEKVGRGRRGDGGDRKKSSDSSGSTPEFYGHNFKKRSLITGSPAASFDLDDDVVRGGRIPLPSAPSVGSQMYKVLHDRDGDYSYAYDCSMSPAFLICYNAEHDHAGQAVDAGGSNLCGSKNDENIYEEINEVKERFVHGDEEEEEEGKRNLSSTMLSSSSEEDSSAKSSLKADSGVHVVASGSRLRHGGNRKFSSDTLDLGPRSLGMMDRQCSRFSNSSSEDSFGSSASNVKKEADADGGSSRRRSREVSRRKSSCRHAARSVPAAPSRKHASLQHNMQVSSEEFSELIRLHHSRVLEQLRLDDFDEEGGEEEEEEAGCGGARDRDSGIQDVGGQQQQQPRRKSLTKMALKLGLSRGRSVGHLQQQEQQATPKSASPLQQTKKFQSFDEARLEERKKSQGWIRKYSQAFRRNNKAKEGGDADKVTTTATTDNADDEFDRHLLGHRFHRSRVTSRWENLHSSGGEYFHQEL